MKTKIHLFVIFLLYPILTFAQNYTHYDTFSTGETKFKYVATEKHIAGKNWLYADGPFIAYHKNGNIFIKGSFKPNFKAALESFRVGDWYIYDKNGNHELTIHYDNKGKERERSYFNYRSKTINNDDGSVFKGNQYLTLTISTGLLKSSIDELYNEDTPQYTYGYYKVWKKYDENGILKYSNEYPKVYTDLDTRSEYKRVYYYEDGSIKQEGKMYLQERKGLWIGYYENGNKKYEVEYDYGWKDGTFILYHENGSLKSEGSYDWNKLISPYYKYDENGTILIKQIPYQENEKYYYLETQYNKDGSLKSEYNMVNNGNKYLNYDKHGICKDYYPNGNLKSVIKFYNDKESELIEFYSTQGEHCVVEGEGEQKFYYGDSDNLMSVYQVRNGKYDGIAKTYYKSGNIEMTVEYKYTSDNDSYGLLWNVLDYKDINGNPLDKGTITDGNGALYIYDDKGKLNSVSKYQDGKRIDKKWIRN